MIAHREDVKAFHVYVDRSKAAGRTIAIHPEDLHWEENLKQRIQEAISGEME